MALNNADKLTVLDATTGLEKEGTVADVIGNLSGALQFMGEINVAADFPDPGSVSNGHVYVVKQTVTDNDPTKTNTGLTFQAGDEIAWNGTTWITLGPPVDPRWKALSSAQFNATPTSTSVFTGVPDPKLIRAGYPLAYMIGGVTYYGIAVSVTPNGSVFDIAVAGAPLSGTIQAIWVGRPEMVLREDLFIAGNYNAATDTAMLLNQMNTRNQWQHAQAFLVAFDLTHKTDDTGAAQPNVNVSIDGTNVSTMNTGNGPQPTASGWASNDAVAVDTAAYAAAPGSAIELALTAVGGNGDAADLTVSAVFVLA